MGRPFNDRKLLLKCVTQFNNKIYLSLYLLEINALHFKSSLKSRFTKKKKKKKKKEKKIIHYCEHVLFYS